MLNTYTLRCASVQRRVLNGIYRNWTQGEWGRREAETMRKQTNKNEMEGKVRNTRTEDTVWKEDGKERRWAKTMEKRNSFPPWHYTYSCAQKVTDKWQAILRFFRDSSQSIHELAEMAPLHSTPSPPPTLQYYITVRHSISILFLQAKYVYAWELICTPVRYWGLRFVLTFET